MLEIVVRAAMGTLLLAFVVQLCLWALRVRRPKLLLSAWTAVLAASVTMPAISSTIPLSGATAARAWEPHWIVAWGTWLTGIYAFVAALLLLRLLRGLALSWNMLRSTQPVVADWAASRKLRTSTWISAPVTVGSHVLLPAECVNWDARMRRAVLAHEGAHVARGDFYLQLLSQVHRSVFWFSPLAWWLDERLTALAELASDDVAIEALGNCAGYAAILRDLARLPRASFIGVTMARPVTVRQRLARIMAEEHPHSNLLRDEQEKEIYHEENRGHPVARSIRHRPIVRLHNRVGHQNGRQVLHVV
jgi:beta-lactamase regulating signal transducer with metallopeptidase domain